MYKQPGTRVNMGEPWVEAASACFERGAVSLLPRPVSSFFVCEKEKLLYSPIAKCACTSVKSLMIELSDLPHSQCILDNGVHLVTDAFITGIRLKDFDMESVRNILSGDEYYKFAVVREPVRRIVSAYTEKFLLNRRDSGNLIHTRDVLQTIRNSSRPDIEEGITFREFVEYLTDSDPLSLDPHWMPQYMFLAGVNQYDEVFTVEQLDRLANRLSERTGKEIRLGKHNVGIESETTAHQATTGRFVDVLPIELDKEERVSSKDFLDLELVAALEQYYEKDVSLYHSATTGLTNYIPATVDLDAPVERPEETVLNTAPDIAVHLNLYTKGFFALNTQGQGNLPVIISNTSRYPIDFSSFSACGLKYEVRDHDANTLFSSEKQLVNPGQVAPEGIEIVTLKIEIPESLWTSVDNMVISMHLTEDFLVADLSPLHVAIAQLVSFPSS